MHQQRFESGSPGGGRPGFSRFYIPILSVSLLWLGVSGAGCSSTYPVRIDPPSGVEGKGSGEVVEVFRRGKKEYSIDGLSFVLVKGERTVVSGGLGYADRSRGVPARSDTIFGIGSVTKLFTAIAIMQLAERGKVDLDAPLSKYLKEFRIRRRFAGGGPVTIRSLLTHHSGLPSNYLLNFLAGLEPPGPDFIKSEDLPSLLREDYMAAPPGVRMAYSNLGYGLLGEVIRRVSGEAPEEYFRRNIFQPLGMEHSALNPSAAVRSEMARGKVPSFGYITLPYIRDHAAGSVASTSDDMARFLKCLVAEGAPLLSPRSFREMLKIQNGGAELDGDFRIGLGFWKIDRFSDSPDMWGHGGDLTPFHSVLLLIPKEKLGVAVMSNSGSMGSTGLLSVAAEAINRYHEVEKGTAYHLRDFAPPTGATPKSDLDYEGTYVTSFGPLFLKRRGGNLYVRFMGIPMRLYHLENGLYAPKLDLMHIAALSLGRLDAIRFKLFKVGEKRGVYMTMNSFPLRAFPLEMDALSPKWVERAGTYRSLDGDSMLLFSEMKLVYEKERRRLKVLFKMNRVFGNSTMTYYLKTLNDREAVIQGEGRNLGESLLLREWKGDSVIYFQGVHLKRVK